MARRGEDLLVADGDVIGSCPLDCPDGCSWVVTVESGRAVRLRGNAEHPFTRGGLCKKVNPWLDLAAEPGRLLHPLRRVAPKGPGAALDEAFDRISWDEALAEIADRFRSIIATTGPAAIWPYVGTGNVGWIQGAGSPAGARLWNHLGVSDHEITICSSSGHAGLAYSMGASAGFDPEDLAAAGTIVIWGSNTLVANQHAWPLVEEARAGGAEVIVIDPVRTRTAARADHHVAPRVGTDGALALGLCRAVIEKGAVDERFVADRTVGFEELASSVEAWTPQRTGEVCGLEPAAITDLAARLTARPPLAIKLGQGMQRHAAGGQTARIISCLPALTGAFAHRGGGLLYSTARSYGFNVAAAAGSHLGPRPRRLAMTKLAANLTDLDPPIEALFVYGANPLVSNPDLEAVRAGLSRPGLFTVVSEIYPTETLDYADVVLPSTMQHEQLEINHSFAHLYVNLNRPAVAPPGECLPHTEMFRRLARALGVDDGQVPEVYASDLELCAALLDTPAYAEAGLTVESLLATGWARVPGTERPHRPMADGFPTESGRFEFASERAAADGHGRLPAYSPPTEAGAGVEPALAVATYDLVAAASDWHVNSVFAGTDLIGGRVDRPRLTVHPDDAARDGLAAGDTVEVANDRGRFRAEVVVDDSVRPGVAFTVKGRWGTGINNTVAERDADMGRGAVFHDNRVTVKAVS